VRAGDMAVVIFLWAVVVGAYARCQPPSAAFLSDVFKAVDRGFADVPSELQNLAARAAFPLGLQNTPTIIMTVVTSGFIEMTMNLVCSWQRLSVQPSALFIALDHSSARQLRTRGFLVYEYDDRQATMALDYGTLQYQLLMLKRTFVVRHLLRLGYDVLVVDNDSVWLENPLPLLAYVRGFGADAVAQPEADGRACLGFILVRASPASVAGWDFVARDLSQRMVRAARKGCFENIDESDQVVFMELVQTGKLVVSVLSADHFPWGAKFFALNPSASYPGVVVVHNNYIIGKQQKIARFRRFNLWFLDDTLTCRS